MADGTIMSGIFKRLVVALIWRINEDDSSCPRLEQVITLHRKT